MHHSARCLSVVRAYTPFRGVSWTPSSRPIRVSLFCSADKSPPMKVARTITFTNLGLRGARERIAHLLLEIYVRLRRRLPAEPGEIIQLPLSQGHIGQAVIWEPTCT